MAGCRKYGVLVKSLQFSGVDGMGWMDEKFHELGAVSVVFIMAPGAGIGVAKVCLHARTQ
jgi:hypothetical protein